MVRNIKKGSKVVLEEVDIFELTKKNKVKYKVVEMHTHHVIVQSKTGKRRCLCNGDLVMMGLARQGGKHE